jgi:hypothetical protein
MPSEMGMSEMMTSVDTRFFIHTLIMITEKMGEDA